jgi:hypothetical protein
MLSHYKATGPMYDLQRISTSSTGPLQKDIEFDMFPSSY